MTRYVQHLTCGLAALGLSLMLLASPANAQSTIRDAETEELLREYGTPLFTAAGLTPGSVDLYIVNDPSLNAFVYGGQNMFIHTGLMLAAETPNELIGVMAHETGHIAGGHLARRSDAMSNVTIPAYLGAAIGIGLMIAGMPEAGMAAMGISQQVAQREFLSYTRIQEAAADQAAMTYMNQTDQSGEGLLTFFDRFRDQEILAGVNQDPYVRSHPLNQERIALLERRVLNSSNLGTPDSDDSLHRFAMVQAKLTGFLDNPYLVLRRYPEDDLSMPAHYARAVAYFREGRTDLALSQIDHLIGIEPENAFYHELRGQILFEGARLEDAIVSYRTSSDLRPEIALLRINVAQALLASADDEGDTAANQEALRNLQYAVAHDNTSAFAWHQMSIAYSRTGNIGMAELAIAEQYYTVHRMNEAREFAIRARGKLPEDGVSWNRAMDIIYLTGQGRTRDGRPG